MTAERPDLSGLPSEIVAYIESLEAGLADALGRLVPSTPARMTSTPAEEPPTTDAIITISRKGMVKRTPRHFYSRQRRGGMGVFDIDVNDDDAPVSLVHVTESDTLLLFTDDGRAFRLPVTALPETPVRARGQSLRERLPLRANERVIGVLPEMVDRYVILLSRRGWVRRVRSSYLGKSLIPGTSFHDLKEGGPLVAACLSGGNDDLFIATRDGKAIRFSETQVPARGCLGIRLDPADEAVAITAVSPTGGVFLLGEDGQGSIRLMSGFSANKAPATGGKVAIKTNRLVGATRALVGDDLLIISRLGKLIRFAADDVPAKEGVVQGVTCMALRADEAMAVAVIPGLG